MSSILLPSTNVYFSVFFTTLFLVLGSLLSSLALYYLGPRKTLLLSSFLFLLQLVIMIANYPISALLLMGRLLGGLSSCLALSACSVYVADCSDPKIRGKLGSLPALFLAFGCLLMYATGQQ